ncbi:MAG: CPXCG motif-containing cysteine-rich protein [Gammaproteobacteria bacterium]
MTDLEEVSLQCPYCGETISVLVDTSAGAQEYFQDCSVCCSPIFFIVDLSDGDVPHIVCKREDD